MVDNDHMEKRGECDGKLEQLGRSAVVYGAHDLKRPFAFDSFTSEKVPTERLPHEMNSHCDKRAKREWYRDRALSCESSSSNDTAEVRVALDFADTDPLRSRNNASPTNPTQSTTYPVLSSSLDQSKGNNPRWILRRQTTSIGDASVSSIQTEASDVKPSSVVSKNHTHPHSVAMVPPCSGVVVVVQEGSAVEVTQSMENLTRHLEDWSIANVRALRGRNVGPSEMDATALHPTNHRQHRRQVKQAKSYIMRSLRRSSSNTHSMQTLEFPRTSGVNSSMKYDEG
jgi:hypothetical protein